MTDTRGTIDTIWRIEAPKIIGGLARLVRDVGLAEELAQDALVEALEKWPETGIPQNPAAWLTLVARRRAIDRFRRDRMVRDKNREVARELDAREDVSIALIEAHMDDDIGDERLALIFTACHPVLSEEARAALTLRLLGGLTPVEIARAFVSTEATIQQRIVRAKKTLKEADVIFEVPRGTERLERLASVLSVIYLIFNEGYAATVGEDWMRVQLCREAQRLGRILAELMPEDSEVLGLLALMEFSASRFGARTARDGSPILLLDQDRLRWDRLLIHRGVAALERAEKLGQPKGPYRLQAEIAGCHATAPAAGDTNWIRIAALYEALGTVAPSPIVELNRAVALSMAFGPAVAITVVDKLCDEPKLQNYHLLPSVRGDLLEKLERFREAAGEFERAAALATNAREKALLEKRASACRARQG